MSTKADIGLKPIAVNLCWSHLGLSTLVTFLKYLPATPGHNLLSLNSFFHFIGLLKVSLIFLNLSSFKFPIPAAAKSLAIPLTDKQSDLLGVKFISIMGSSKLNTLLNWSPTLYLSST